MFCQYLFQCHFCFFFRLINFMLCFSYSSLSSILLSKWWSNRIFSTFFNPKLNSLFIYQAFRPLSWCINKIIFFVSNDKFFSFSFAFSNLFKGILIHLFQGFTGVPLSLHQNPLVRNVFYFPKFSALSIELILSFRDFNYFSKVFFSFLV